MKTILGAVLAAGMLFSGAVSLAAATLNDDQVAQVLLTIDQGEIKAARMAEKRASSEDVKDFARRMIDAHNKDMLSVKTLTKASQIKAKDSDLSKDLKTQAMTQNKQLKKSEKNSFDRDYIDRQVTMHQKALSVINDTLLPSAQNKDLKEHLEKTRTAVSAHLARAKEIQAKLQ